MRCFLALMLMGVLTGCGGDRKTAPGKTAQGSKTIDGDKTVTSQNGPPSILEPKTDDGKTTSAKTAPRATELKKAELVNVFYATDRKPAIGLVRSWSWYGREFLATVIVAGLTVIFGIVTLFRRRWLGRLLTIGGLLATGALGEMAAERVIRAPGGSVRLDELYGGESSEELHFGSCEVSIPPHHVPGTLESPSIRRLEVSSDPKKHVTLQKITPVSAADFYDLLRNQVAESQGQQAFVFVHGYNVTFADAVRRTAQLCFDLDFKGVPICYSWPSQGKWWQYLADEENVRISSRHLWTFLRDLANNSGASTIYLIAHSMGNRALTSALERLGRESVPAPNVFREVVLTAPDVYVDEFKPLVENIQRAGQRVTLYASSNDEALKLSSIVHAGQKRHRRLGESGENLFLCAGIDTVDASAADTSLLGHSYYGESESVLGDLRDLILHGLAPTQRARLRSGLPPRAMPYWLFAPQPPARTGGGTQKAADASPLPPPDGHLGKP